MNANNHFAIKNQTILFFSLVLVKLISQGETEMAALDKYISLTVLLCKVLGFGMPRPHLAVCSRKTDLHFFQEAFMSI